MASTTTASRRIPHQRTYRAGPTDRLETEVRFVARCVFLLGQEAGEPVQEDGEEHDRLLRSHRHAPELLVGERREAPDALRRVLVDGIRRAAHEREHEAD